MLVSKMNKTTLIKQRAQSEKWLCLIAALFIASFAMFFIPYAHEAKPQWFSGLFLLSYLLIRLTMGFSTWIYEDSEGKRILCLRDAHANTNSYLPLEFITHVEYCDYSMWNQKRAPSNYANRKFHRIFTQLGYHGSGLIVCYRLPKSISGDCELRSWQFPAPKSEAFLKLMTA